MKSQNKYIRRRFKIWHGIIALLLLLFVLFRVNGSLKVKKQIESLRTKGYPVTLEDLDRWYNMPEGEENGADVYMAAFSNYVEWDKEALKALPIFGKAPLPARTQPLDDPNQQLIEKFLSDNEKTLKLLHEAASIEHCRYPIDLTKGSVDFMERPGQFASWFEYLQASSRLLRLETLSHCENQDSGKALESIRANFALAKFISAPLLNHRLVHNSVQSGTYKSIEQILNRMQLSDEQLLSLSAWIKESRSDEGYMKALVGERCIGLNSLQAPIRDINRAPRKILGSHDRDIMEYIRLTQEYIDAMELPPNERLLVCKPLQEDVHSGKFEGRFTDLLRPAFERYMMQIDIGCTAKAIAAQTTLAIERYRLSEGHMPESLDNLVPVYMEFVPTDPFDGQSLKYRALETGFVVYSVGEDLTDQGGAEHSPGRNGQGRRLPCDITFIMER
jgi:hypothetical protein